MNERNDESTLISENRLAIKPSPSAHDMVVSFVLKEREEVSVDIFDNTGKKVTRLFSGSLEKGMHNLTWDMKNEEDRYVPDGIYFCKFTTEDFTETKKMVVVR